MIALLIVAKIAIFLQRCEVDSLRIPCVLLPLVLCPVSVLRATRLARGLPAGSAIDYLHRGVLEDALAGRRPL